MYTAINYVSQLILALPPCLSQLYNRQTFVPKDLYLKVHHAAAIGSHLGSSHGEIRLSYLHKLCCDHLVAGKQYSYWPDCHLFKGF